MGKYQLDDKGRAQVARYHEKHSTGGGDKKARLARLREQFLHKQGKEPLVLRRPTLADEKEVIAMLAEFEREGSAMDGGLFQKDLSYADWLEANTLAEQGLNLPAGYVPAIQYVSFDTTGKALGFLHLRLRLSEQLREEGGHIGYSIRPSQRRKGYAKYQLRAGLKEAASKQLDRVLVTCDSDNEGSRRTILSCGGRLEDCRNGVERYWITTQGGSR